MCQRHAMPLSFYPLIPYFQVSDHIVTAGVVNTMLSIGYLFFMTHWRIFIHSWRSYLCHYWRRCGTHLFPLFKRWSSRFRKYLFGVTMCAALLRFPMRDYSLSVFIFVKDRYALITCTQVVSFCLGRTTHIEWIWLSHPIQVLRSVS